MKAYSYIVVQTAFENTACHAIQMVSQFILVFSQHKYFAPHLGGKNEGQ